MSSSARDGAAQPRRAAGADRSRSASADPRRPRSRPGAVGEGRREGDAAGGGARAGGERPEPAVLLTLAHPSCKSHSGQIAFPGGKIDPTRCKPAGCGAARGRKRRSGSTRKLIEPIGYLDLYLTFSGYRILPTGGARRSRLRLKINPGEVADAFEVPLEFLMDARQPRAHSATGRASSGSTTPCRSASATSGA